MRESDKKRGSGSASEGRDTRRMVLEGADGRVVFAPGMSDVDLDAILARADAALLASFETQLAVALTREHPWSELRVRRLAVDLEDGAPRALRPTEDGLWVPVRVGAELDWKAPFLPRGRAEQALLDELDNAVPGDSSGLSVMRWREVVDAPRDPAAQCSLEEARGHDPEVELGDELGFPDDAASERARRLVIAALRRRAPLRVIDQLPAAMATSLVEAALAQESARAGHTREELLARVGGGHEPKALDRAILDYDYDLESEELARDPDAPDHLPTELARLVPCDRAIAEAFARMHHAAYPPPPEPGYDVEGLLERWRRGEEVLERALALAPEERRELINRVAGYRDLDHAWHLLFALAEADGAALLEHVEQALAGWSDGARVMPRAWWQDIRAGRFAPTHRLVRQLVVERDEVEVLLQSGVERSLGGLTGLGLSGLGERELLAVLQRPWLAGVRELHLLRVNWTAAGVTELATTRALPGVRRLTLSGGVIAPEQLAALWLGSSCPALERLSLATLKTTRPSGQKFPEQVIDDPVSLRELASALRGRPLARPPFAVVLKGLGVDTEGVRAIAEEPSFQALTGVDWLFSPLETDAIQRLAAAPLQLRRFALHLGKLGEAGARALAGASWIPQLEELELPAQSTGDAPMAALLRRCQRLRALVLRHNSLAEQTAEALAQLPMQDLQVLELSYNRVSDEQLARALANPSLGALRVLEALGTGASTKTCEALRDHAHLRALERVNLGDEVSDEGARALAEAELPSLRRVQLRGVSAKAIAALDREGVYVTNAMYA